MDGCDKEDIMQKPTTVIIQEFREEMAKAINNSGLPWWKIKDELEFFILPQVKQCAIQEEQAEQQEWQKALKEEEKQKLEKLRENRVSENEINKANKEKQSGESEVNSNG